MNDLIIKDEDNNIITVDQAECILDEYYDIKETIEEAEKKLRECILNSMLQNNIVKSKIGKYTVSLTNCKDIEVFNENDFLKNENEDIVKNFVNEEKTENFNLELFKKEHFDLYNQYTTITVNRIVDSKKLNKYLPNVYQKYISIKESDKKVSLRISGGKK